MRAHVLTWTRVERPPAGFPPGRVVALVEGPDGVRRYAVWEGGGEPPTNGEVAVVERGGTWVAR